jgi:hypothetical protein
MRKHKKISTRFEKVARTQTSDYLKVKSFNLIQFHLKENGIFKLQNTIITEYNNKIINLCE